MELECLYCPILLEVLKKLQFSLWKATNSLMKVIAWYSISGERIEINLTHASNGVTENFTLKTNANGECRLEDLIADNFTLSAKFNGNKDYEPAMITGTIYVKKIAQSSSSDKYKTDNKVDDVIDGWDPSEHEVSREDLGDGTYRITYDDGYFRIVDEDGNILTYGY